MAVTIQHGSRTKRSDGFRSESSITWQGTYEEIAAFKETLMIGSVDPDLGTLVNTELSQGTGCIWLLTLDYKQIGVNPINIGGKDKEPIEQELSAQVLSVPIEAHPNYRTCWNHFLVGACRYEENNYTQVVPSWYLTATDPYLDPLNEGKNYKWVKNLSEAPIGNKYTTWGIVKDNITICRPTKPGVTSFDKAYFVIKETGFHSRKEYAGWATSDLINTIVDKPLLGDFSLTRPGYNWKVDDIQVAYNGEEWVAIRTYTLSGDANGWDRDLYS